MELLQVLGPRRETGPSGQSRVAPRLSYIPGTAFVMMRINPAMPELRDVRDTVVDVFREFGVTAIRADDLEHSEGITERIIKEIKDSEHLFADYRANGLGGIHI